MQIDNETKIVSSIAIKQSKFGAIMHNSAYQRLDLNFIYIPLTVADCKNAIFGIRALNFRGTTVSMPHKQEVMKYIDKIDAVAQKIGAVNTIVNDDGVLTGYNSDWVGAVSALKEVCELKNKTVVLVGAGGVARAIAYGLKENNSKVIIFNRTLEKAEKIAKEFNVEFGGGLNDIRKLKDYDILINATSVGFSPSKNESIIDESILKENKIVLDVVFSPLQTSFLRFALNKNCKVVPGYRMLIHQALFQFELFTGKKAPFEIFEKALINTLK
jgi:shikimate dehydrogenase